MLQNKLLFIICIKTIVLFGVSAYNQKYHDVYIDLPAYMIAMKAELFNLTTCTKELQEFRDAVDHGVLWSMKMLDASGTIRPGFLHGNNYWLGSLSQCHDLMKPNPLLLSRQEILNNMLFRDSKNEPSFRVNYFVVMFKHNSTFQYHMKTFTEDVISLGLCLPESCINEISSILETIFHNKFINDLYAINFQLIKIKDLKTDNWSNDSVLYSICVSIGFFLLLTIIGTLYDVFIIHEKYLKKINRCQTNEKTEVNSFSHEKSKIEEVLLCFSAYINMKQLLNMDTKTDETFLAINGLKVIWMCILILLHSILFSWDVFDNKIWIGKLFSVNYFFIIHLSPVVVDVFFVSSGYLTTSLYLHRTKKSTNTSTGTRGKFNELFICIIKRFVRLTPVYMIVLGITQISLAWFEKTSQFYIHDKSYETCLKYWWRNFLYINNLFDSSTICMPWTWYVSSDMQFYIITMILLIFFSTCLYIAATIVIMILTSSVILSGYILYNYEYVPTIDRIYTLADATYFPPWIRIQSYIIGVITGYILIELNKKKNLILNKKITIVCWSYVVLSGTYILVFPFYEENVFSYIIYITLFRLLWAISIAWILIACHTEHGGVVNRLLSFKIWIPLSKLTYGVFLLNPIIIQSISFYRDTPMHFNFPFFFVSSILYIIISYICSFILSLVVETPCNLLLQMFIHKNKKYK